MCEKIEIVEEGIYRTNTGDIVKILSMDKNNDVLKIYNISDSCKQWKKLSKNNIVEKIR